MDVHNPQLEQEALLEGQRAGQLGVAAGANPYPLETPQAGEWERGRRSVEARKISAAMSARARTNPCPYRTGRSCTCGGRGICLDVA